MKIGLMGLTINSTNQGCVALSYSMICILEKISKEIGIDFEYVLFEFYIDESKVKQFCDICNVDYSKFTIKRIAQLATLKNKLNFSKVFSMISGIKMCDVIIDATFGDSFTDIYGENRFYAYSNVKKYILAKGIPLILAPQTYGPFKNEQIKTVAKEIVKKAYLVSARDNVSTKAVEELCNISVIPTIDMAFELPYEKQSKKDNDRINVGLVVSGLLTEEKIENTTERNFSLLADYDSINKQYLEYLLKNEKYDVYLISHVNIDIELAKKINSIFPQTTIVPCFENPIEAKNFISKMDILVGARMHATIAAITTGVATIPLGYSKKFRDLYETLDYNYTVDLELETTEIAVEKLIKYTEEYKNLSGAIDKSLQIAEGKSRLFIDALGKALRNIECK